MARKNMRAPAWTAALVLGAGATGALSLTGGASAATVNLLTNPGFETGDLTGWTCDPGTASVVTAPVHSGSYALAGTATATDDAECAQTVSVQPNTAYTLSGWVTGDYVYLGVTGAGTTATSTWTPAASGWQQLSTGFTTGASTTSVTVYVHGWYGEGGYGADDLDLAGPSGAGASASPTAGASASASPSASTSASPSVSTSASTSPSASASPSTTPSSGSGGTTVQVSNASQLYQALNKVVPGETIQLAAGVYNGEFTLLTSGTAAAPITLEGPAGAVITGTGVDSAYGIHLEAGYWNLHELVRTAHLGPDQAVRTLEAVHDHTRDRQPPHR